MHSKLDIINLQVELIYLLWAECGISQHEVSKIVDNTNILEFIKHQYFVMHQQGDHANLCMIRDYLSKNFGIHINVKPMKINSIEYQY